MHNDKQARLDFNFSSVAKSMFFSAELGHFYTDAVGCFINMQVETKPPTPVDHDFNLGRTPWKKILTHI